MADSFGTWETGLHSQNGVFDLSQKEIIKFSWERCPPYTQRKGYVYLQDKGTERDSKKNVNELILLRFSKFTTLASYAFPDYISPQRSTVHQIQH